MTVTLDKLANGFVTFNYSKAALTSKGAGLFHSLWKGVGYPAAGASGPAFGSGSGYVPTNTTVGALGQALVSAGNEKYLAQLNLASVTTGSLFLADRMWHCSGLVTNIITAQTIVTPGTLTAARDPLSGYDVEPWVEINTVPGATGATWTLTGTDSTGTAGRTWTYTHPASAEVVGQICPMVPGTAVGGCRIPSTFTCNISSGTAGDVGIVLLRRLTGIVFPLANVGFVADTLMLGNPRIYDGACIFAIGLCTSATIGATFGTIGLSEITP